MKSKQVHYISGLGISLFIILHLINHATAVLGADKHIEVMQLLRRLYRNSLAEACLLLAVGVQIISGIRLFISKYKKPTTTFDKLHLWSGLYMAFFFIIHVSAILTGRFLLKLDTNFYFGVAGLNTFPLNLFFIPYYSLAIISFFVHIAMIHAKKMRSNFLYLRPDQQAKGIMVLGICLSIFIMYGLTNGFKGLDIPQPYRLLNENMIVDHA